jgi:glycosyltransferase involved in cell wall biosynthesis
VTSPAVLVNLGELPFSTQRRRNQVIFEHLANERSLFIDALYIDPARASWPRLPSMRDLSDFVRPVKRPQRGAFAVANPTFLLPFSWRGPVARAQIAFLANRLRAYLRGRPYCLWVNNPDYLPFLLAEALRPGATSMVVDLSDDFTAFSDRDPVGLERRVRRLVADSDVLITVNEHVARKFPHAKSLVFPNATDFEALQRYDPSYSLGDVLPKPNDRRIVGFIGGLHTGRVDEPLLMELITRLKDAVFLFLGYSNDPSLLRKLASLPNVRVFAPVPFDELGSVIRSFDVAIVPHLDNEFTRGNDLLKVRDYLACGVPVVTTRCSGIERYGGAVYVADSREEFISAVAMLMEGEMTHNSDPGIAVARTESWLNTLPRLVGWLEQALLADTHPSRTSLI